MLARQFYTLLEQGRQDVFGQSRTHRRALEHAPAFPCSTERRTIAQTIWTLGREQQDWSTDYKIFSRSPWQEDPRNLLAARPDVAPFHVNFLYGLRFIQASLSFPITETRISPHTCVFRGKLSIHSNRSCPPIPTQGVQ